MGVRRQAVTLGMDEIYPYPKNPRLNDKAVEAVVISMEQCGVIAPIIVDENHVILAGHTRYKALERLGYVEAECVVVTGLAEDQKRKYRILDNKTAELAEWDEDLLNEELEYLNLDGFRWFDEIVPIEATGDPSEIEDDDVVRCPRCGAFVAKL